jgi:HlyD family secretion protein
VNGEGTPAAVWVLKDDKPVRIPVVAGLDDDSFAEIMQGDLKADDPVILSEQRNGTRPAGAASNGPRLRL